MESELSGVLLFQKEAQAIDNSAKRQSAERSMVFVSQLLRVCLPNIGFVSTPKYIGKRESGKRALAICFRWWQIFIELPQIVVHHISIWKRNFHPFRIKTLFYTFVKVAT